MKTNPECTPKMRHGNNEKTIGVIPGLGRSEAKAESPESITPVCGTLASFWQTLR
jgi:hypothetical protein